MFCKVIDRDALGLNDTVQRSMQRRGVVQSNTTGGGDFAEHIGNVDPLNCNLRGMRVQ